MINWPRHLLEELYSSIVVGDLERLANAANQVEASEDHHQQTGVHHDHLNDVGGQHALQTANARVERADQADEQDRCGGVQRSDRAKRQRWSVEHHAHVRDGGEQKGERAGQSHLLRVESYLQVLVWREFGRVG